MDASYVFRIRFRVEPRDPDVRVEPATFETVLRRRATTPGEDGWLFFRDNCWRGKVNDEAHVRDLASEALGVDVETVSFSELVTDKEHLDALNQEITENLDLFRADDSAEVLNKYLGSSIRIEE